MLPKSYRFDFILTQHQIRVWSGSVRKRREQQLYFQRGCRPDHIWKTSLPCFGFQPERSGWKSEDWGR